MAEREVFTLVPQAVNDHALTKPSLIFLPRFVTTVENALGAGKVGNPQQTDTGIDFTVLADRN
jgi:hypothetical protein